MLSRITATLTAAVALLVLGSAGASAQDPTVTPTVAPAVTPTPTPTVTPTPTPVLPSERSKSVKKVYKDYRGDGVIEACDHTRKALKKTLKELLPEADIDTPDLRPALEAAIEQHHKTGCDRNGDGKVNSEDAKPGPTGSTGSNGSSGTPSPTPTVVPTVVPTPVPTTPPSTGTVKPAPPVKQTPPSKGDVVPLAPTPTPVPPAAAVPPAAEPSGPAPTPAVVYRNGDDPMPVSLLVLAGLLALLAVLALVYVALGRLGWADERLARPRRAWREAAFRTGGTWADFSDWIRVGR